MLGMYQNSIQNYGNEQYVSLIRKSLVQFMPFQFFLIEFFYLIYHLNTKISIIFLCNISIESETNDCYRSFTIILLLLHF